MSLCLLCWPSLMCPQVECLDNATRAKGMAMLSVIISLLTFVSNFATPVALKNIQYNYIFFFAGWDVIISIIWYFFAVETVGCTLEELAEVFEAPVRNIISPIRISCALMQYCPESREVLNPESSCRYPKGQRVDETSSPDSA